MSATMDESISEYFNHPPAFEIPGVTFPIQDFYLVGALSCTRSVLTVR
jgi:HrpA-like RNA helicase